jgi:hypothetical protein
MLTTIFIAVLLPERFRAFAGDPFGVDFPGRSAVMKRGVGTILFALVLAAGPAQGQGVLVSPYGDQIILTDPLVRTTQLGYLPVGTLAGLDTRTGVAWALVAGAGGRWVRLTGAPARTAAGLVAPAVDLATGVELQVVAPAVRESLVPATLLRVTGNGVTVRRRGAPASQAELLPLGSIYLARGGWTLPAGGATSALAPGAAVLIPASSGARGAITVERPATGTAPAKKPAAGKATKPRR